MNTFLIIIKLPFVDYMKIVNKHKYLLSQCLYLTYNELVLCIWHHALYYACDNVCATNED